MESKKNEIKCRTTEFNGRQIKLYESSYKGKNMTFGSIREALLFSMGYGSDQAAELRYMMKKIDENPTEHKGVKDNAL